VTAADVLHGGSPIAARPPHRPSGKAIAAVVAAVLVLGAGTFFGVRALNNSHSDRAGSRPVPVATASTPSDQPTPAPETPAPETPVAPAVPVVPPPAPRPTATDPDSVVQEYFAAITARDYPRAWALGGKNLQNDTYASFVSGLAGTASDTATILSTTGDTVSVQLDARQTDGSHRFFLGSYTVEDGAIVSGNVQAQ
jgi:hypothetical protein